MIAAVVAASFVTTPLFAQAPPPPPAYGPPITFDAAKKALDDGFTTYTNPAGMPALREAIAEKFARDTACRTTRLSRSL